MEELRPDLLPVSTATSTSGAPDPTITATTHTARNRGVGGGGGGAGTATVGSGLSVISSAVPSAAQTQQVARLPPPPSKGAVPMGGVPLAYLLAAAAMSHTHTYTLTRVLVLLGSLCLEDAHVLALKGSIVRPHIT